MKKNTQFKMGLLTIILFSSCSIRTGESMKLNSALGNDTQTAEQLTSFKALKANIFDPKCSRCHSSSNTKGGVDLSTYITIMSNPGLIMSGNSVKSLIYTEVQDGSMPQDNPPLSALEVKAIQDWINVGAPDGEFNTSQPTTPPAVPLPPVVTPPVQEVSYKQVQTQIFNQSCVKCHSGLKPSGAINLSSYAELMGNTKKVIISGKAVLGLVFTEIQSGSMPPRGPSVDATLTKLLQDWINQGAKNN